MNSAARASPLRYWMKSLRRKGATIEKSWPAWKNCGWKSRNLMGIADTTKRRREEKCYLKENMAESATYASISWPPSYASSVQPADNREPSMSRIGVSVTLRKNHTLSQTILYGLRIAFIHRRSRNRQSMISRNRKLVSNSNLWPDGIF